MSERRVVLVGHDGAPSKAFSIIGSEFEKVGWQVDAFLGVVENNVRLIKQSLEEILAAVEGAKVVLLGMSVPAKNARKEIAVAEHARKVGKPYGLYADTFGAAQRPWFGHLRKDASFLFVLDREEAEDARKIYPDTTSVVVVGNHEFESASFPKFSREEIRAKIGINDDEKLIVVPGHKSVPISCFLLMSVVHALHYDLMRDYNWRVIFTPHPGDNVPPQTYAEPVLFTKVPVEIMEGGKRYVREEVDDESLPPDERIQLKEKDGGYPIFDLLPGADLMVESASTFCMSAAILRVPVISVLTEVSKQRNVPVFGQREWKPVVKKVAVEAYGDLEKLSGKIYAFMRSDFDDRTLMHLYQEALYSGFKTKGEFERTVVEALNNLIK